jgi:hypothetical protein
MGGGRYQRGQTVEEPSRRNARSSKGRCQGAEKHQEAISGVEKRAAASATGKTTTRSSPSASPLIRLEHRERRFSCARAAEGAPQDFYESYAALDGVYTPRFGLYLSGLTKAKHC